jgi:Protein of unknown function (DUF3086)
MSLPDQDPQSSQPLDLPLITVEPIEEPKIVEPAPSELDLLEQELTAVEMVEVPEPVLATPEVSEPTPIPAAELERLQPQLDIAQRAYEQMTQTALVDLEQRRQNLKISIEQLERKRDRIQAEIAQSFAGSSQEIAVRIQGFKDYLVGSLQDLVVIAEEIEFPDPPPPSQVRSAPVIDQVPATPSVTPTIPPPQFKEPAYKSNAKRIQELLGQYQNSPDYYASPWQMRRSLEQIHIDRTKDWFFQQGGRGALKSGSGRMQNVIIASTAISVLRSLYGDYLRVLVLANTPERLGEWRRGLLDCLGLERSDFGPNGGVMLFEEPEPLAIKAEKIEADRDMPFIILDDSDGFVSLALLKYPIWLAFAPEFTQYNTDYRY